MDQMRRRWSFILRLKTCVTWTGTRLTRKASAPKDARKATRSRVPVQMSQRRGPCRCGSGGVASPGAYVSAWAQPRCRCGRGDASLRRRCVRRRCGMAGATPILAHVAKPVPAPNVAQTHARARARAPTYTHTHTAHRTNTHRDARARDALLRPVGSRGRGAV
jgi:hypothetical protein